MENFSQLTPPLLLVFLPLLVIFIVYKIFISNTNKKPNSTSPYLPRPYPIIGHLIAYYQNKNNLLNCFTTLLSSSPSSTVILHLPFGTRNILTANPAIVEHVLKTKFPIYQKGPRQKAILGDVLGDGIFNADGDTWKFQRQVASHEFSTKSLRKFVETVVDSELNDRLIPILSEAAKNHKVLDLQDIFHRFGFDNICKIAFGYDPEYLSPALPQTELAVAFDNAVMASTMRYETLLPFVWKICRFFNVGLERKLNEAVLEIRGFANNLVKQKLQEKQQPSEGVSSSKTKEDLLSRFLKSGHSDEKVVTDIVISFILAGRDSGASALTWFFWLLHQNKHIEEEIITEVNNRKNRSKKAEQLSIFEEVKDMVYTHAALCESMRLYPPVPVNTREATANDILPDGTRVEKGMLVSYHSYSMGRMEKIWGPDWAEFRPNRWLEIEEKGNGEKGKLRFVGRDPYSFPIFHGGPRICIGKDMAFLQMKSVVAGILERFRVIPIVEEGFEPVYLPLLSSKMKGGFLVRVEERIDTQ